MAQVLKFTRIPSLLLFILVHYISLFCEVFQLGLNLILDFLASRHVDVVILTSVVCNSRYSRGGSLSEGHCIKAQSAEETKKQTGLSGKGEGLFSCRVAMAGFLSLADFKLFKRVVIKSSQLHQASFGETFLGPGDEIYTICRIRRDLFFYLQLPNYILAYI